MGRRSLCPRRLWGNLANRTSQISHPCRVPRVVNQIYLQYVFLAGFPSWRLQIALPKSGDAPGPAPGYWFGVTKGHNAGGFRAWPLSLDVKSLEVANKVVDLAHARLIVLFKDRLDRLDLHAGACRHRGFQGCQTDQYSSMNLENL